MVKMHRLKFEFLTNIFELQLLKDAGKYFDCVMLRATVWSAPQVTFQWKNRLINSVTWNFGSRHQFI